jgi:putative transposase
MLRAYKYRLCPNDEQKQQLARFFGAARFVYNLGLETKMAAWTSAKKNLNCFDLSKQLKQLKDSGECDWLKACVAQSLQGTLANLDNAYTNFFRGGGFPKFKKKSGRQSIQFPQNVRVIGTQIFIPKLKMVDFIQHRPLGEGKIKTTTLSMNAAGEYYVSILIDNEAGLPPKKGISEETAVGIDVGLKTFATLSNGTEFENPKYLHEQLKRLRIEQRTLARRYKKGKPFNEQSKGWHKQRLIVAKLHQKIANKRKDFLHKVSTEIVNRFDTICLEDLNIQGMQQNRKLAKSISDVSWNEFTRMLEYKAEWHGKNISYIGRFDPSSKLCSNCGYLFKELTLSIREWTCEKCSAQHQRDQNAAINIKNFGLRTRSAVINASR